jgi:manganese/zinc/iron transport system substrate-binding protein
MLSVGDIQKIIDHLQRYDVKVIFSESNINQDSIRKIVSAGTERGLEIRIADCSLFSDAMGCEGSQVDTYLEMIEHNAHCIVDQLH